MMTGLFSPVTSGVRNAAPDLIAAPPAAWLVKPPGEEAANGLEVEAAKQGWPSVARSLRNAATDLYLRRQPALAEAWYHAARWAEIFGQNEETFLARWRGKMQPLGLAGGLDPGLAAADSPMGARVSPEFRKAVLADPAFSKAFFELLREEDYLPHVLSTLDKLRRRDGAVFAEYASLALALAVVYDCAPPAYWPHGQVSVNVLPRRLPDADRAFSFLVATDRAGKSLHRLRQLEAGEMRFLVDLAASFDDLAWAQANVRTPMARLAETYSTINYSTARLVDGVFDWPGPDYSLPAIKREGGICVDQAYFATQAGKARGVPTLLFCGAGLDGRHAWFGYLDGGRRWRFDAGRYEEQKYVTGVAIDPQTWGEISDHEVAFMAEGFRRQPAYQASRVHSGFARWFLEDGREEEAVTAARAALVLERRNLDAWDLLLRCSGESGEKREALAREAARNFQSYPELQADFLRLVAKSLWTRGKAVEAEQQERETARRFQAKRSDLSMRQIAEQMARAIQSEMPLERQLLVYRGLLRQFGRGAGVGFYDEVARPFVLNLILRGQLKEARAVLTSAVETLGANPGSQFGEETRLLERQILDAEAALRVVKPQP